MALEWKQRCVNKQTAVSDQKIWESVCGKYRVVFSHIRYGGGVLPDVYYAMEEENSIWQIISRHRRKKPATQACEKKHKERQNAIAKLERLEKRNKRKRQ